MPPVIIADADPALRRAIRRALGALAGRVLQCETAIDALVALEAERGTMLVLGPSLGDPGVDEVIDMVRASRSWAELCVVCVVPSSDATVTRALMERGATACIVAPPGAHGAATFKRLLAERPEPAPVETLADALAALRCPSLADIIASAARYAVGSSLGEELAMTRAPSADPADAIRVAIALTPRIGHRRTSQDDETRTLELLASASDLRALAGAREPSAAPLAPRELLEQLASVAGARVVAALAERGLALASGAAAEPGAEGERLVSDEVWLATARGECVGARMVVWRPASVVSLPPDGAAITASGDPPRAPRPRIGLSPAPKPPLLGV